MNSDSISKTIVIVALALFTLSASLLLNNLCIYTPDSACYLTLALSMARGNGYRDINLPGDPPHLKYPPLYPILLLPAAFFFPHGIIMAGKIFNILISVCALLCLHRVLRRVLSPLKSALVLAATALNPIFIQNAAEILSESAYILFSSVALLLVLTSEDDTSVRHARRAGIAAAISVLTRIIGVSLVISGLIFFCVKRAWRKAAAFFSVALFLSIPWMLKNIIGIFQAGGTDAWGYWGSLFLSHSPGASSIAMVCGGMVKGAVYYVTALSRVLYPFLYINETELASSLSPVFIHYPRIDLLIAPLLACATPAIILLGIYGFMKDGGKRMVALYALCSMTILVFYPARQLRLLIPVIPFLWCFFLEGGAELLNKCSGVIRFWKGDAIRLWTLSVLSGVYFVLSIALSVLLIVTNLAFCGFGPACITVAGRFSYDLSSAAAWLQNNADPSSVILCDRAELFLRSGRKVVGGGQYESVFGGFERNLREYKVAYIVGEAPSGVSVFHRLMANALMFDFEKAAEFPYLFIHKVIARTAPREPYGERYDLSIDRLVQEVRKNPRDPEAHKELGYFYFKEQRLDEAAEEFRRALEIDPGCPVTWFNLGSALLDIGRYDEALVALGKSLEVRSADLIAPLVEPSIRIAKLKKEIAKNPHDSGNFARYMEAAALYFRMKEFSKAREDLARASELQPVLAEPHLFMGDCYARLGRKEDALKSYQRALELNPAGDVARERINNIRSQ
ncbi:MAG: tetratricopeptide repeat protein [Candidatus Aureabacteria bacterium]|nr:tetratricopeptide repeat protein [Candidatus Auribacterota bacterium]